MLLTLLLAAVAQAKPPDKPKIQVTGHAGFGGVVERGEWTPLTVDLDNRGDEDLDLVLSVTWGQPGGVQSEDLPSLGSLYGRTGPTQRVPVSIAARSRKRLALSSRAPRQERLNAWIFAENARTGRALAAGELLTTSLPAKKRLAVVVGADRLDGFPGFTSQAAPEHLPEDWRAYAAVDTLLWLDAKASELRSQAQVDALRTWIELGGRFVVARASEIGLAGTPIADLVPAEIQGGRPLASLKALARPGGTTPDGQALVLVSKPLGRVRLEQDGVPLLVEASRGAGSTLFVAFDPTKEPLVSWKGLARFWTWATPVLPAPEAPSELITHSPESVGSVALARQLATFPDVAPPEVDGLFILIGVYLVVVGPFDYFLLRKLRRLELTWLTFPAYVALFTLLILLAGGAFIERAAYQREIVVVDRAADASVERRRALSAVLAPRNLRYAVDDAEPVSCNYLISQLDSPDLGNAVLTREPGLRLRGWTVSRGATGVVAVDRSAPPGGALRWELSGETLAVKNDTGKKIQPAALLTADVVYEVDELPPGASKVRVRPRGTIERYLRGERARVEEPAPPEFYDYRPPEPVSVAERRLDEELRKLLLALSLEPPARPLNGFAKSLDLRRALASGGSVLVAWEKPETPEAAFDPAATRYSGLRMVRYLQGPER
jgi:hypothetical protein